MTHAFCFFSIHPYPLHPFFALFTFCNSGSQLPHPFTATEEFNSIVEVQVRLLGLTLVKAGHPLARASISQVVVRSVGSGGNLTLNGRLGSLSLVDCSSHSLLYPEKFITAGSEAMTFQLFKWVATDIFFTNCFFNWCLSSKMLVCFFFFINLWTWQESGNYDQALCQYISWLQIFVTWWWSCKPHTYSFYLYFKSF